MFSKGSVKAPSYEENIYSANATSREQLQMARDQAAWGQGQDELNQGRLNEILDVQGQNAQDMQQWGQEDRARYENTYRPMEDRMIADAEGYDSVARREKESSSAMADVSSTFDAARKNALSRLEGYGVDPSQTRNAALDVGVRTQEALGQAAAAKGARDRVEDTGREYRNYALQRGDSLPGQAAAETNAATQTGAVMTGEALNTSASGAGMRTSGQGFTQLGEGANMDAASIKNTQFGNQVQAKQMQNANKASLISNVAGIAGAAMGGPMGAMAGKALAGAATGGGGGGGGGGGQGFSDENFVSMVADGGKVGKRTALPMSSEFSIEDIDRHIAEVYGASEANTRSKALPRALPPAPKPYAALPIRGHEPMYQEPLADGGVPGMVDEGPSDGTGIDDQVSAKLSVGEYVIPADVVAAKGKEFFDKMLSKYHVPAEQQRVAMGSRS